MLLIVLEVVIFCAVVILFIPLMWIFAQSADSRSVTINHREFWRINATTFSTSDSVWDWTNTSLVPSLFGPGSGSPSVATAYGGVTISFPENEFSYTSPPLIVADTDMVLIGAVRLRQLRVQQGNCSDSFPFGSSSVFCQSEFESSVTESKEAFSSPHCPSYIKSSFLWSEDAGSVITSATTGLMYPSSGYSALLPADASQATQLLSELKECNWIDRQTSAVIFEATTYHPSLNFFAWDQILFEFSSSGSLAAEHHVAAIPGNTVSFSTNGGKSLLALDILNLIFFAIVVVIYAVWFFAVGFRLLLSKWTFIDLLLLAMQIAYIAMRAALYRVESIGNETSFVQMSSVIPLYSHTLAVQTVVFILLIVRAFKFTQLLGRGFPQFLMAVGKACVGVIVVACLAVAGFGFAYHVAVGFENPEFVLNSRSLGVAAISLINVVWTTELDGIGAFLTTWYIWFVYLVLMPVLIVLVIHSSDVKIGDANGANPIAVLVRLLIHKWKGRTEVEAVNLNDGIQLKLLPEVIKNRIYMRRRTVHSRVEASFGFSPIGYSEFHDFIDRDELERLLVDDPFVAKVLGVTKVDDVVKMFNKEERPVQRLQAAVDRKIEGLQKSNIDLHLTMDPAVDAMSQGVQAAIAKVETRVKTDVAALTQMTKEVSQMVTKIDAHFDKLRRRRNSDESSTGRK